MFSLHARLCRSERWLCPPSLHRSACWSSGNVLLLESTAEIMRTHFCRFTVLVTPRSQNGGTRIDLPTVPAACGELFLEAASDTRRLSVQQRKRTHYRFPARERIRKLRQVGVSGEPFLFVCLFVYNSSVSCCPSKFCVFMQVLRTSEPAFCTGNS